MRRPTPTRRHLALAAAMVATLALSACTRDADDTAARASAAAEPAPAAGQPTATPASALAVSAVTLGTTAGADGRIATPMTTFTTSDPIVVSIDTHGEAARAELTVRLVHQDGRTASEQSETISSSGSDTTNITFTNANGWPAGSYRAEVRIDGTQARSREFTVR